MQILTTYLTQTIYPTRSTTDLDALIGKTMEALKKIICRQIEDTVSSTYPESEQDEGESFTDEERRKWLEDVSSWTPRNPLFNWDYISARLATSLWKTAHTRYRDWHNSLPKRTLSDVDSDSDSGVGGAPSDEATNEANRDRSHRDRSVNGSKRINLG